MDDSLMHTTCLMCGKHAVSVPWGLEGLPYANYSYCPDCIHKAMKLLKEQKAVEPTVDGITEYDGHGSWWYQCGKCKMPIDHGDKFCRRCGQAVKWE